MKRVRAYGPACVGNVAAGFDVLGAAVAPASGESWGDIVEIGEIGEVGELDETGAIAEVGGAGRIGEVGRIGEPGQISAIGGGGRNCGVGADGRIGGVDADAVAGAEGLEVTLVCDGPFAHQLPADPAENVAVKACAAFARVAGGVPRRLWLRLTKGLPVGSGLGSSSATVVAVVRGLAALLDRPPGEAVLLAAAGEAEAHAAGARHLDNVAAALLGGLRLVDPVGEARLLPWPDGLRFVLAVPALTLTTRASRAALPVAVPFGLAVAHAQNLAALVHALHAGDRDLTRACLRDLLAEPHRAGLVPGLRAVQVAAMAAGAWGCSLSGAGPAVFAVAEEGGAPAVGEAMGRAWTAAGVACETRICVLDRRGARVLDADAGRDGACG